jgi:hypothetical protein
VSAEASGEVVRTRSTVRACGPVALYEETQFFHPIIYGVVAVALLAEVIGLGYGLSQSGDGPPQGMGITAIMLIVFAAVCNILLLRVRVDGVEAYITLGWLPLFWTRIPLDSITLARPVTYRPLWDSGGWGLRFGRFEGAPCRYWNARGNKGVLVHAGNRVLIIGSQTPDDLLRALTRS